MKLNAKQLTQRAQVDGQSWMEVLVAIFILAVLLVSLSAGLSSGFAVVRLARENLRATQILVQKTEQFRLYPWEQVTNSTLLAASFVDYYDPSGTNSHTTGVTYSGKVSNTLPTDVPSAYRNHMRALTVTVFWTNSPQSKATNMIVHSRQMWTLVARYGMQNYFIK